MKTIDTNVFSRLGEAFIEIVPLFQSFCYELKWIAIYLKVRVDFERELSRFDAAVAQSVVQ
jgi:hypothetical protein